MRKIPERKERKRLKRSKDRSSHRERKKRHVQVSQEIHILAWDIVGKLPHNSRDDVGKKYLCVDCGQHYCINHHKQEEFCRTCFYKDCCSKSAMGKQLTCYHCEPIH